jgi:hypothetical protein
VADGDTKGAVPSFDLRAMARARPSASAREAGLAALVAALLGYSFMFADVTVPNERTRVYLAVALVDHGTLSIDPAVERFGPVADAARFEGRRYTDKAPGSSLLGAAVYGVARIFTAPEDWTIAELVQLTRTAVMVPLGVLGFLLARAFSRRLRVSEPALDVTSLAFALGSAAFHYSAAFFGHYIVAVLLLLSLFLLAGDEAGEPGRGRHALAGAAAGLAGLTEYQAIVVAAMIFAFVVVKSRGRPSSVAAFALGALPFAALLLAYDALAFGGPFELSYQHLLDARVQARHTRGVAGVGAPIAEATQGILFSLHRGLLATSPVAVFAPFGLFELARRGERALAVLLGAFIGYYLLFVFGADMWFAGWGFGPRLLVPCLGAVFLAVGPALDRALPRPVLGGVARGLAAFGIVAYGLVTEVFAELPPEMKNPWLDVVKPALERGLHSPNLLTRAGASPGLVTLAPAWALTALALFVVLSAGLSGLRSRARVARASIASALTVLAFCAIFEVRGPSVEARSQRGFLAFVERLAASEREATPRR